MPIIIIIIVIIIYLFIYLFILFSGLAGFQRVGSLTKHFLFMILRRTSELYVKYGLSVLFSLLLLLYLSPVYRVFTITYHKQTMSLRYTVLQLFCIYSLCYM